MKICYLDAFSGISGDMTVGALLDAGADSAALLQTLESLGTGAKFQIEKTSRRGIAASKFHVIAGDAKGHRHLKDILLADPAVASHLAADELERLFDPLSYLGAADALVGRVLAASGDSPGANDDERAS